ncbi:MAG: pyrroline-5-carboxylate reductase [Coriobacteriia bacterium]|nr:pyrroline-5-carboxylate reductase [Coriobacteriia bacterium]
MEKIIQGTLLVVGGGAMGEAIIAGILDAGKLESSQIVVIEPNPERRVFLEQRYQLKVLSELDGRTYGADDVCLFAVKPQIAPKVLAGLAEHLDGTLFISIAIGVTIQDYYALLDADIPVVRAMPNMPVSIGQGMSLISCSDNVSEGQARIATQLFESVGAVEHIPEEWQSAGATISGSGPAYFSYMIDALIEAGDNAGLPTDLSKRLAAHTAVGVSKLLLATDRSPREIMYATASPGGITEAALQTMDTRGVHSAIKDAFVAAVERAGELEDSF